MLKKNVLAAFSAALAVLVVPSLVSAYGAAHVGYTHVGPSGVQHYGETAAHGPGGAYAGSHGSAYGSGGSRTLLGSPRSLDSGIGTGRAS